MANAEVEVNYRGLRDVMRSTQMLADMRRRAAAVAAAAGPGYASDASVQKNRARGAAWTATPAAVRSESKTHRLTGALRAAR